MDEAEGVKLMILLTLGSIISFGVALASSDEMQADVRARLAAQIAWWRAAPRQVLALFHGGEWRRQLTAAAAWAQGRPAVPAAPPAARRPQPKYGNTPMPSDAELSPLPPGITLTPLPQLPWMAPGTHRRPIYGGAADTPPSGLAPILQHLAWYDDIFERRADPLRFPVGWSVRPDGELDLECGTFRREKRYSVTNVLISGQIGSGKDVLVRGILLSLMLRSSPADLNVVIMDGKGLDYVAYADTPHVVQIANDIPDIPDVLTWLDAERERRKTLLREAKAKSWADAQPSPFPLLVVYISELTTLERFVDRFWEWLNDHLSLDRALGICYLIGTQTASNTPTRWRRQVQMFLAGYQPSSDDDRPNTNVSAGDWKSGVLPPSKLPLKGGGYFTVILGRVMVNARAGHVTDAEETQALDRIRATWPNAAPVTSPPTELVRPSAGGPESPQNRPNSADSAPPSQSRTGSPNQFDSAIPDTNAVRGTLPPTELVRTPEPTNSADSAPPNQDDASSANQFGAATPDAADGVRQISRSDLIRLLALQRNLDTPGEWAFSANRIVDFVGGTRTAVLDAVRAARNESPGSEGV